MEYILMLVGFLLLIQGGHWLTDGSSSLAKKVKISPLLIGLTVVAFGTSAPELFININASVINNSGIALGNVIGSNIVNLLFILGCCSLIMPLTIRHSTIWKEIPFSLLGAVFLLIYSIPLLTGTTGPATVGRAEGITLILFFIIYIYYAYEMAKTDRITWSDYFELKKEQSEIKEMSLPLISFYILLGIVALYLGGKLTVDNAVLIAKLWHISDYLISVTIIAIGTGLPEIVTAIIATLKKEPDLVVGNIVGSNIFNILLIIGLSALINPLTFPASINSDVFFLCLITLLLFLFMFIGQKHVLQKWQGAFFLTFYLFYLVILIFRGIQLA